MKKRCQYIEYAKIRLVKETSEMERVQVRAPEDIAKVLYDYFADIPCEHFVVLALNTANVIVGQITLTTGGLAASIVEPRAVFQYAILQNAAALIFAHNHPSGNLEPSREDIRITRQLVEAGKLLGIPVHDHLVIHGKTYVSMAERGLLY